MKKNMKKLAVGFGVFVMAVGSLMGCSSLGSNKEKICLHE